MGAKLAKYSFPTLALPRSGAVELTLPLRLFTDSHILYGHMIAQKQDVKETAYRKKGSSPPLPLIIYP